MSYIVSMILLFGVSLVLVAIGHFSKKIEPSEMAGRRRDSIDNLVAKAKSKLLLVGVGIFVVGSLVLTIPNSVNQIKAGHVGVMYQFGAIVGQVDDGLQFVFPWRSVRQESVQTVGYHFKKIDSFSFETQDVFVAATLNLNISPEHIQKLYRTVGPKWFETLVVPRVNQFFKDETVKYKSVDIAPNREKIRHNVTARIAEALRSDSITVSDLLIDNIDFDPKFKTSIENKQIASQDALAEEQRILGAKHIASQKVETARGEGEAILIKATKQAEANAKLAASVTPNLINYMSVEKLSPNIQVMMIPSGQGMILGPEFMGKKPIEKTLEK